MSLRSMVGALVLFPLGGCVGDAWAQHAGSNPDPHARRPPPGPSVLDVLGRSADAGAATTGDAAAATNAIGRLMGDPIGDRFGRGGLGATRTPNVSAERGATLGFGSGSSLGRGGGPGGGPVGLGMGGIGYGPPRHARFDDITIAGPMPEWHVRSTLRMVAARAAFCLNAARPEARTDVAVRFVFAAPPVAPTGEYDTPDAALRRCLASALAPSRLMPSTPVTQVTARFRIGFAPDGGR